MWWRVVGVIVGLGIGVNGVGDVGGDAVGVVG